LLRLLNTRSTLGRRLRETVRTDGQTDTHAVATSVLQSQQASGIPYAIHLKNGIDSTSIKRNPLLYRGKLPSDTFTAFYLLEVRQTMATTDVV